MFCLVTTWTHCEKTACCLRKSTEWIIKNIYWYTGYKVDQAFMNFMYWKSKKKLFWQLSFTSSWKNYRTGVMYQWYWLKDVEVISSKLGHTDYEALTEILSFNWKVSYLVCVQCHAIKLLLKLNFLYRITKLWPECDTYETLATISHKLQISFEKISGPSEILVQKWKKWIQFTWPVVNCKPLSKVVNMVNCIEKKFSHPGKLLE